MIPFGLSSLMTLSLSLARRVAKCGLVPGASAIYLFNEGSGQVLTDYSGNGYHGTLGSTAGDDTNDPAWTGQGLAFTADDYVGCGTAAGLDVGSRGDFSIIAVVTLAPAAEATEAIFGKVGGGGANEWGIARTDTNHFRFYFRGSDASNRGFMADAATQIGTPTMVACVRSGDALLMYLGTVMQANSGTAITTPSTASRALYFGRLHWSDSSNFNGTGHAGAIYPFALAPHQIAQNYAYFKALVAPRGVVLP